MLFVDFRQVFGSVQKVKLYEAMRDMGMPLNLTKLTKMAMSYTKVVLSIRKCSVNNLHLTRELSKVMGYRLPSSLLCYIIPLKAIDQ